MRGHWVVKPEGPTARPGLLPTRHITWAGRWVAALGPALRGSFQLKAWDSTAPQNFSRIQVSCIYTTQNYEILAGVSSRNSVITKPRRSGPLTDPGLAQKRRVARGGRELRGTAPTLLRQVGLNAARCFPVCGSGSYETCTPQAESGQSSQWTSTASRTKALRRTGQRFCLVVRPRPHRKMKLEGIFLKGD